MTREELYTALSAVCNTYYNVAPVRTPIPYAVFTWTNPDNFPADDVVYHRIAAVEITVYSDTPETEDLMKTALDELGVYWTSGGAYEGSDGAYIITYNMEVIDNG